MGSSCLLNDSIHLKMLVRALEWSVRQVNVGSKAPTTAGPECSPAPRSTEISGLYSRLLNGKVDDIMRKDAAGFLRNQLAHLDPQACELPASVRELQAWILATAENATANYGAYLAERKAGGPRRYFSNRAHALFFLGAMAPTKLVDGAWLFGLIPHCRNPRFSNLVRTYLEELGEGQPDKNHVLIYRQLLERCSIEPLQGLDESLFTQGLIQLALAYNAKEFLPELIGFNLGYEQLPLHLLITAYELNELGLDPYYFTLHITVDNTDTGHAHRAVRAVLDTLPKFGDTNDFWRRVRAGCQLGEAGVGTCAVVSSFNLDDEVVRIFSQKSAAGHGAHSDYCRVAGRHVNDWLAAPDGIPAFLDALQEQGWIRRGEPVENSRFWGLLQGQRADMFGVFSHYELQLIHDWIRGEASVDGRAYDTPRSASGHLKRPSFRAASRRAHPGGEFALAQVSEPDLLDTDLPALLSNLAQLDEAGQNKLLVDAMSPSRHWTPAGLYATRLFCQRQP